MIALRFLPAIVSAVLLWLLAAFTLSQYEMDVRVLRPWQRIAYGVAAFVAGVLLALAIGRAS